MEKTHCLSPRPQNPNRQQPQQPRHSHTIQIITRPLIGDTLIEQQIREIGMDDSRTADADEIARVVVEGGGHAFAGPEAACEHEEGGGEAGAEFGGEFEEEGFAGFCAGGFLAVGDHLYIYT